MGIEYSLKSYTTALILSQCINIMKGVASGGGAGGSQGAIAVGERGAVDGTRAARGMSLVYS